MGRMDGKSSVGMAGMVTFNDKGRWMQGCPRGPGKVLVAAVKVRMADWQMDRRLRGPGEGFAARVKARMTRRQGRCPRGPGMATATKSGGVTKWWMEGSLRGPGWQMEARW